MNDKQISEMSEQVFETYKLYNKCVLSVQPTKQEIIDMYMRCVMFDVPIYPLGDEQE